MKIERKVYDLIMRSYSKVPPEAGGIIGEKNGVICAYVHDTGKQSFLNAEFVLDTEMFNRHIEAWAEEEIDFCGIVHSHLPHEKELSNGDLEYIKSLFDYNKLLEKLVFPLVIPNKCMIVFTAYCDNDKLFVNKESIEIVN